MYKQRDDRRKNYQHSLDEDQIGRLIEEIGVEVMSETSSHFLVLCPFHANTNTSSATVAKENGYLFCFGAGCGVHMPLIELVKEMRQCDTFPALRFIKKFEIERDASKEIEEIFAKPEDMPLFDLGLLEKYQRDFWDTPKAQRYIASRGISKNSAQHFGIGYDTYNNMVITPMFDAKGQCVGTIGRTIEGEKRFKNSFNLPTSKTLFNFHNAKRAASDSLVLVEANFDAIRAHQSGYPNVCACLGGSFTEYHISQIARTFSKLIIATDNDEAGHKFANRIARVCRKRSLPTYRIRYSGSEMLPHDAKDFGDCDDIEIAQAIRLAEPFVID